MKRCAPRCSVCGRFVALGLGECEPGEVIVEYTPDHEYGGFDYQETYEYTHKLCSQPNQQAILDR